MDIRLDGKRALVTGGSSGIGAEIVRELSAAGAKVCINYHSHPADADKILDAIKAAGGEAIAVQADVADSGSVQSMFEQIDQAWDGIDIVVNCAGIDGKRAVGWDVDSDEWRKVVSINLFGAFECCRQALKRMIPHGGGVVLNISSVHEQIAWSGYSAYTASKGGIGMMTKTLAQEAAPHGVRVLNVAPGAIKTPINQSVWSDPDQYKDLLTKIPLGRIGETKEIAQMVVVLVSDVASYITGQTIYVDGGMTDYPEFARGG